MESRFTPHDFDLMAAFRHAPAHRNVEKMEVIEGRKFLFILLKLVGMQKKTMRHLHLSRARFRSKIAYKVWSIHDILITLDGVRESVIDSGCSTPTFLTLALGSPQRRPNTRQQQRRSIFADLRRGALTFMFIST